MEMPEEFKTLIKLATDPAMERAYAGLGETPIEFFLHATSDKKALKRLNAYLAYLAEHPDRHEKDSALWQEIDSIGKFPSVRAGQKVFAEARQQVRRRL